MHGGCSRVIKSRPSVLLTNEYSVAAFSHCEAFASQPGFCFLWKSPVFSWAASRQALVISLQIACSFRLKMTLLDISDKLTAGVFPGGPFVLWFVTNRVAAPSQDPQQDGHGLQHWTADETLINVITRCGIWIKKCSVLIQQITSCTTAEFKDILLVYGKNTKWSAYP